MEKHPCKLSCKKFSNGKALGGHMRSHMINLPLSPPPSSFDSESEEGEIFKEKLRRKEKEVVKLVEETGGSSSITLHDKESDTESTKYVITRRRSKRRSRKPATLELRNSNQDCKFLFNDVGEYYGDDVEQQAAGSSSVSVSEVTSEKDVAICLMMLSRDKWTENHLHSGYEHKHEHKHEHGFEFEYKYQKDSSNNDGDGDGDHKKKYKCETCNKLFKSYQALGGHRASHKKTRVDKNVSHGENCNVGAAMTVTVREEEEKKIHECPICLRVFASGQALGGHKRSHVTGSNVNKLQASIVQGAKKKKIIAQNLIDLNLPAPIDDDDDEEEEFGTSQIANSSTCDVHL